MNLTKIEKVTHEFRMKEIVNLKGASLTNIGCRSSAEAHC